MWEDIIVNEIRKYRDEHASEHKYNSVDIYNDLKNKEQNSTHKKVTFQPKKYLKPTGTMS